MEFQIKIQLEIDQKQGVRRSVVNTKICHFLSLHLLDVLYLSTYNCFGCWASLIFTANKCSQVAAILESR